MGLVKITELTEQVEISSRTLRYYEQMGLITSIRSNESRYRFYDEKMVERIQQIIVLRKMQIPLKDIIHIYESEDMSVVVEVFVKKIAEIEEEVDALNELKSVVDEFLQTMKGKGIKKISAIPLLYEEMDKRMQRKGISKLPSLDALSKVEEHTQKNLSIRLVQLEAMRVLTSYTKESGHSKGAGDYSEIEKQGRSSDTDDFWKWLHANQMLSQCFREHELFEFQDKTSQTVMMLRIGENFENDTPFLDQVFSGGLFAVCSFYADESIAEYHHKLLKSFDSNPYYQVDYLHNGELRQEPLLETVPSLDETREMVELYLPIRHRMIDTVNFSNGREDTTATIQELDKHNRVIEAYDIDLRQVTPILNPYYEVDENGEAHYISWVSQRRLSTNIPVKIPFCAEITFKTNDASMRLYHGNAMVSVNTGEIFDLGKMEGVLSVREPVFGGDNTEMRLKNRGGIRRGEYNHLKWIVGENYFAVIINDELRYCSRECEYMKLNVKNLEAFPVIVGSNSSDTVWIKSIKVSRIMPQKALRFENAFLSYPERKSNHLMKNIHMYCVNYWGQNYSLNGCMEYVMECMGEDKELWDYWFFSGVSGDQFTQVYCSEPDVMCMCLSSISGPDYVKQLFDICGYEVSYVESQEMQADLNKMIARIMAYVDREVPVICRTTHFGAPFSRNTLYSLVCGYEDYGKTLLILFSGDEEVTRIPIAELLNSDWIFVGEKKASVSIKEIYRKAFLSIPKLIRQPETNNCTFGIQAFRDWAAAIENGHFDNMTEETFNKWKDHDTYVCMAATNAFSMKFFERAKEYLPELPYISDVMEQYQAMGELRSALEEVGGGFSATLANLQDVEKRKLIADRIRAYISNYQEILAIFEKNIGPAL